MFRAAQLLVFATLFAAVQAQTPPVSEPPAENPAAPKPAPETNSRPGRAISSELAASLASIRPKYNPPKPVEKKSEEELPDLREIDKPKNTIVRLPKVVVSAPRPAVFTERDIYTKEGLAQLAVKRYLTAGDRSLNSFTLPLFGISNEARALAAYAEDERLKNMSGLADTAKEIGRVDPTEGASIKKETDRMYLRSSEFGRYGGGNK